MKKSVLALILGLLAVTGCGGEDAPVVRAAEVRRLTPEEVAKLDAETAARREREKLEEDYRMAHSEIEEGLRPRALYAGETDPIDEHKLVNAARMILETGILERMPESAVDLDRALAAVLEHEPADEYLLTVMKGAWDRGQERERLLPALRKMREAHLAVLAKAKFDPNLRWRDEDIAMRYRDNSKSPYYCSQVPQNVRAVYELTHRLMPDTAEERKWLLHDTDLILYNRGQCEFVGDSYHGEEAYKAAYEGYLKLGMKADADRAAREAATETLGYYVWGSMMIPPRHGGTPPGDPEIWGYALEWLERIPADLRTGLLRKYARSAEEDKKYDIAERLYGLLGDRTNAVRMGVLKAA